MTVTSTTSRWEAVGNGSTTVFPYNNKIFADTDLKVYLDGVLQTLTTHYTVSGAGLTAGGNVTFLAAPANGVSVVMVRDVTNDQQIDYPPGGAFPANSTEDGLDRRTIISQQNNARLTRALRYRDSDAGVPDGALPALASLKGKFLRFDASTGAPDVADLALQSPQLLSRSLAQALSDTSNISVLAVYHGGTVCYYEKDASGTALTTADGQDWSPLFGTPITPQHFGAVADGVTDDADAINLAFAFLKATIAAGRQGHFAFHGVCKVQKSIGAFGIVPYVGTQTTVIEGYGAKILVNTADLLDKVILDIRGSTNIHVKGLEISAAVQSASEPLVGLAWGRTSSTLPNNCDRNHFEDVRISGRYGVAAGYNSQSEVNGYYNCQFLNSSTSTDSYGFVLDGINHFNVPSDFTTLTLAVDTIGSLSHPTFFNCWFAANSGSAASVFISSCVGGPKFVGGYALQQTAGSAFELYVLNDTEAAAIKNLDCQDIHVENTNATSVFKITGPATAPIIQGIRYTDNNCFVSGSVFERDASQTVTINDLNLHIATFPASPDPDIFDDPAQYTVTPKVISLPPSYAFQFPRDAVVTPATTSTAITTVGSFRMAGLGADSAGSGANPAVFTPQMSGKVRITVAGSVRNSVALSGVILRVQYGTGTAPAVDAATAGTAVTSTQTSMDCATPNQKLPFHLETIVTGLELGTQIWADLGVQVVTSGNVFVNLPRVTFEEV